MNNTTSERKETQIQLELKSKPEKKLPESPISQLL